MSEQRPGYVTDALEMIGATKPPIGIEPEYIWKERRVIELLEAALRYLKSDFSNSEYVSISMWLDQASKLCHEISESTTWKPTK